MKKTLYVFGAGGGAVETLEDSVNVVRFNNLVFIEDNPKVNAITIDGSISEVISLDMFTQMLSYSNAYEFSAIVTPVDISYKKKIYALFPYILYIDMLSKASHILTEDVGLCFNARAFTFVGSTVKIGNFVKLNYHSVVAHNTVIGDYTFISHNVGIGANVNIGSGCYIYENATILPGITIGDNTVIGAGSLVTKDIPANVVAYGLPCKVVRDND